MLNTMADTQAAPDKYLLELLLTKGSLNETENAWFYLEQFDSF